MTNYTVLAYRQNGLDTCRGCVMAESDSDFEFRVFPNEYEAAEYWAGKEYESLTSAREFCEWDLTLLINGSEDYPANVDYVNIRELAKPYLESLKNKALKAKEEKAAIEAAKLAEKVKADNAAREAAEMEIFFKVQKRLEEQSHANT